MKWILMLFLMVALPCRATIPDTLDDLKTLYGNPIPRSPGEYRILFKTPDNLTIYVSIVDGALGQIEYDRDVSFNELEIEGILKPLSVEEDWKQTDDNDWVLPKAKATAHWNGEGKVVVTAN